MRDSAQSVIEGEQSILRILVGMGEVVETLQSEQTVGELNFHTAALRPAELGDGEEVESFEGIGVRVIEEEE